MLGLDALHVVASALCEATSYHAGVASTEEHRLATTWLTFPHPLYHLLDLLLIQADQLPIAVDNGVFDFNTMGSFTPNFHD